MEDSGRKDIRRLLKTFGIGADEALVAHFARHPTVSSIRVRITLQDLTDYGELEIAGQPLHFEIEDVIHRQTPS